MPGSKGIVGHTMSTIAKGAWHFNLFTVKIVFIYTRPAMFRSNCHLFVLLCLDYRSMLGATLFASIIGRR